jgi:hypothetical protein
MHDDLDAAIDRNAPAVISLPSAGMVRHFKTRFLRVADEGFWVEGIPSELPLIKSLIETADPAGFAFKAGSRPVNFLAPLRENDPAFHLTADVTMMAIRVQRPAAVKAVQRRSDFRVAINANDPVRGSVWRIGDHAAIDDRPKGVALPVILRDLSTGGIGVVFTGADGKGPTVTELDRLLVVLQYRNDRELAIEGSCTRPTRVGETDQYLSGIRFKGLQDRLSGRQTMTDLARIVNALQLAERQRLRA